MTPCWLAQTDQKAEHAARMTGAEIEQPHAFDNILVRLVARDFPPAQLRLDDRLEILQRIGRAVVLQRVLPEGACKLVLMHDDLRLAEIFDAARMVAMQM